jgi:ATP-binding cassette subfamily F protein uup
VELGGGRRKHAMSYLQDFLFTPDRARAPIRELSGGERSRLLLALLFSRPSNLLVMDEPTNDLDLETLELLEERVADYEGTLLLVSHDRAFLDHVVTSLLVLEGDGRVDEQVGGYADWLARRQRGQGEATRPGASVPSATPAPKPSTAPRPAPARRGLGYKEKRELAGLPGRIEQLEERLAELGRLLADPATYQGEASLPRSLQSELAAAQAELDGAYLRWEELEGRSAE